MGTEADPAGNPKDCSTSARKVDVKKRRSSQKVGKKARR